MYSARYAGGHGDAQANIDKLLDALREVPDERRGAHFHAAIVLLRHAEDPQPLIAEGSWHGRILHARRGDGGFGYDPVFLDPERGRSEAELDPALKNRISHRGLRSEEHTYELQSLMRISYAVSSLKKKITYHSISMLYGISH